MILFEYKIHEQDPFRSMGTTWYDYVIMLRNRPSFLRTPVNHISRCDFTKETPFGMTLVGLPGEGTAGKRAVGSWPWKLERNKENYGNPCYLITRRHIQLLVINGCMCVVGLEGYQVNLPMNI